jgi:hypothetical protein
VSSDKIDRRIVRRRQPRSANLIDLVGDAHWMHVELLARSTSVFSFLIAASAPFALKAGLWFRHGRLAMVSSRFRQSCRSCADLPLDERVQISRATSRCTPIEAFAPNLGVALEM